MLNFHIEENTDKEKVFKAVGIGSGELPEKTGYYIVRQDGWDGHRQLSFF